MIRIGVVDDHTMFRESLMRVIGGEDDLEVVAAVGNASEALAVFAGARPEVAVVDIGLPDTDGLTLAGRLRDEVTGIGIVFLTMHDDVPTIRRAVAMGIDGYLVKSAPVAEFLGAIRTVAEGGSHISAQLTGTVMALAGGRDPAPAAGLTEREVEVLRQLAAGHRPDDIAELLCIAPKTVKNHLSSIYTKLDVDSAAQAVAAAYRLRIAQISGARGEARISRPVAR